MRVLFLGTASGKPSNHRNVTSIAVIIENAEYLLVDCGEATQHQIMKSSLKLSKLRGIFISHLHGDHIFGLPGLLCTLNEIRTDPLPIYGPKGLTDFLRFTMKSITNYHLEISEISKFIEHQTLTRISSGNYEYLVQLASIVHTTTTFAYKFTQIRVNNKVDIIKIRPHLDLYREELIKMGYTPPNQIISALKSSPIIEMTNGFTFKMENYQEKENEQTLIVALDNCDTQRMCYYFTKCDMLIHESTYACFDEDMSILAQKHAHSTNRMAAKTAIRLSAKQLVLTHFSNRYDFEDEEAIIDDTRKELNIAKHDAEVYCARDLSEFCICSK